MKSLLQVKGFLHEFQQKQGTHTVAQDGNSGVDGYLLPPILGLFRMFAFQTTDLT